MSLPDSNRLLFPGIDQGFELLHRLDLSGIHYKIKVKHSPPQGFDVKMAELQGHGPSIARAMSTLALAVWPGLRALPDESEVASYLRRDTHHGRVCTRNMVLGQL